MSRDDSDREGSNDHQENGSQHLEVKSPSPRQSPSRRERRRSRSCSRTPHSRSRSQSQSRRRHSYSRSRSRSYSRKRHHHYKSKSKSRTPKRKRYSRSRRSRSRSPTSSRRRHRSSRLEKDFRDNPEPCRCLGVFGLSLYTQERDLKEVFAKYGPVDQVQVVYDAQSGRSRGFAFVYFENIEDAEEAKERCNGLEIDGRKIRVDFSITKRAHTPTPGIYMGKPTFPRYGGGSSGSYRGRSPSPYYRGRRYSRSRSRSYSPRKYYY